MFFRVNEFNINEVQILLSNKSRNIPDNAISIITGKNAIGKSKLLSNIISYYIKKIKTTESNDIKSMYNENNNKPKKIIVITNNSVDRFPIKNEKDQFYEYFGNRTKHRATINDKYEIFRKIILHKKPNTDCLKSTLSYLDFHSYFNITFTPNIKLTSQTLQINNIIDLYFRYNEFIKNTQYISIDSKIKLSKFNPEKPIDNKIIIDSLLPDEKFFFLILKHLSKDNKNIKKIDFETIINFTARDLSNNSVFFVRTTENFNLDNLEKNERLDSLKYLLSLDLLKISNVNFKPLTSKSQIEFYSLSSGQQSLLKIFLGISSCIDHNSLICIDEPEVNLHPKWQTEFILKIQELFKIYFGCHFLIATHSPQIVSGLTSSNGFVIDLENNITYSAENYSKRSADYQLAKIFNSPGYNNEYILKICFHLLSIIKENKEPSQEDLKLLQDLHGFQDNLNADDPSLYLIKQVQSFFG